MSYVKHLPKKFASTAKLVKDVGAQKIIHNFNPGPGTLPRAVMEEAANDFRDAGGLGIGVVEMSHRSQEFQAIAR